MVDGGEVSTRMVNALSSFSCSKDSSVSVNSVRLLTGGGEVPGSSEISIRRSIKSVARTSPL